MTPFTKEGRFARMHEHFSKMPYEELLSIARQSSLAEQLQGKMLVGDDAAAAKVDNYKVLGVRAYCLRTIELRCVERFNKPRVNTEI
jgi:hypothetical protein